jgi:hypothetical protein
MRCGDVRKRFERYGRKVIASVPESGSSFRQGVSASGCLPQPRKASAEWRSLSHESSHAPLSRKIHAASQGTARISAGEDGAWRTASSPTCRVAV